MFQDNMKTIFIFLFLTVLSVTVEAQGKRPEGIKIQQCYEISNSRHMDLWESSALLKLFKQSGKQFLLKSRLQNGKLDLSLFQLKSNLFKKVNSIVLKAPESLYETPVFEVFDSVLYVGCQKRLWVLTTNGKSMSIARGPVKIDNIKGRIDAIYYHAPKRKLFIYDPGYFSSRPEMHEPRIFAFSTEDNRLALLDSFDWNLKFDHLEPFITFSDNQLVSFKNGRAYCIHPFLDSMCIVDLDDWSLSCKAIRLPTAFKPDAQVMDVVRSELMTFMQIGVGYKIRDIISNQSPSIMAIHSLTAVDFVLILTMPDSINEKLKFYTLRYNLDNGGSDVHNEDSTYFQWPNREDQDYSIITAFNFISAEDTRYFYVVIKSGENINHHDWRLLVQHKSTLFHKMNQQHLQILKCTTER